jgi:low affinity Fe/Cu permease
MQNIAGPARLLLHSDSEDPRLSEFFRRFACWSAEQVGSAWAFIFATALVVVWALTGPVSHYSDSWELVINTITTVITFLMVFLIQNAQNRHSKATQLKLDELLRGVAGARTGLVRLEQLTDAEIAHLEKEFEQLRERHRKPSSELSVKLHGVD